MKSGKKIQSPADLVHALEKTEQTIAVVVFNVILFSLFWQAVSRKIGMPSTWTDETSRLLFVWMGALGCHLAQAEILRLLLQTDQCLPSRDRIWCGTDAVQRIQAGRADEVLRLCAAKPHPGVMPRLLRVRLIPGFLAGHNQETLSGADRQFPSAAVEHALAGHNKMNQPVIPLGWTKTMSWTALFFPELTNSQFICRRCNETRHMLHYRYNLLMQHFDATIQQSAPFVKR